jgi:Na+/H+ antiporter NhaC
VLVAAALGGGVFGDHCSPISDTTVVSALAAGCDVLDHVWTQLPYALFGALLTSVAYLVLGVF